MANILFREIPDVSFFGVLACVSLVAFAVVSIVGLESLDYVLALWEQTLI